MTAEDGRWYWVRKSMVEEVYDLCLQKVRNIAKYFRHSRRSADWNWNSTEGTSDLAGDHQFFKKGAISILVELYKTLTMPKRNDQHCQRVHSTSHLQFLSCGATVQLPPWPPHCSGFWVTQLDTHTGSGCSELVISSSQRPLPTQHTTNTTDEHPRPLRESNPQSQKSKGYKPTSTAKGIGYRILIYNLFPQHLPS